MYSMQRTERLVAITLLLQARGKMTAKRLGEILGVSTRTIYRDIIALSLAHVPVSMDYGPGGGYYLPEDYHLESALFTREEAVSLVLSADMSGNYSLFAGDNDLHRALNKLEAALPEEYHVDVRAARERILFDTSAWGNQPLPTTHLETIRAAVLGAYQLEIFYSCSDCPGCQVTAWRRVEPYGLVFKGLSRRHARVGVWYLVAFCQLCQHFYTFRVNYIEQMSVLKERITPRPDFNLRAYWREARKSLEKQMQPATLVLRVSATARHRLGGNCTIRKEEPDGSVIVRVDVESVDAAISYALGLGADATVRSPPRVRDAVAATAHASAEMYDKQQV